MKRKQIGIISLLLLLQINVFAQSLSSEKNYPVPVKTDKLLFYIQRSHNKNTIVYDINLLTDGKLNTATPIRPYWIRYEEGGVTQDLSFIQRKYAYGLNYQPIDVSKESYKVFFVCYSKKYIYLVKSNIDLKFHAYISLNGRLLEINKVFIKTEGGTFWFPVVRYVEVSGIDVATNQYTSVRFTP